MSASRQFSDRTFWKPSSKRTGSGRRKDLPEQAVREVFFYLKCRAGILRPAAYQEKTPRISAGVFHAEKDISMTKLFLATPVIAAVFLAGAAFAAPATTPAQPAAASAPAKTAHAKHHHKHKKADKTAAKPAA